MVDLILPLQGQMQVALEIIVEENAKLSEVGIQHGLIDLGAR